MRCGTKKILFFFIFLLLFGAVILYNNSEVFKKGAKRSIYPRVWGSKKS